MSTFASSEIVISTLKLRFRRDRLLGGVFHAMPQVPMFRTARLSIGHLCPNDYDRMLQIYGDPVGARWVGDGQPISPEDCARWVDVTLNNYATRGYGMSVVRLSGEIVGFAGLVHPGGQEVPELKYAFAREHWGHGFATEVGLGMLAYGASTFGMARIIATAAPENLASLRVLEKIGMVDIGTHIDDDGEAVVTYEWIAPGTSSRPDLLL